MSGFSGRATLVLATSALVAGAVVWGGFRPNDPPVPQAAIVAVHQTRILVATRTVQPGDPVAPDDFHYVDMPIDSVHDGFLADTEQHRATLTGMAASRRIPAGTPFVEADLTEQAAVQTVASDMTAAPSTLTRLHLATGMRAIALPVKAETAVAGLLELGDRVDILLSYEMAEDVMAIRTVLRNVRIIATDQTTQPPTEDTQEEPKTPPKIVTFELTPEGAKVLALADQMGDIMLVLSEDDAGEGPVIAEDAPIFSSQISGQTTKPLPTVTSRSVSIVRGAQNRVDVLLAEEQVIGDVPAAVVSVPSSSAE